MRPPDPRLAELLSRPLESEHARQIAAEAFLPTLPNGRRQHNGHAVNQDQDGDELHLTDVGNGKRVVDRHGENLRYCWSWKQYLVWDGKRWCPDESGAAVRLVKETQAHLYRTTAETIKRMSAVNDDDPDRKRLLAEAAKTLKHALGWEDARRISASLDMARSEPGIPIRPAEMDADPYLLNVENGTIDLKTGRLREHRREDKITKLAPVAFDPAAGCPIWLKFLDRIMDGNKDLIDYLRRVAGYTLTGDVNEQCLWFLHGSGANGKSTYLVTLLGLLGDYGWQAVPELLLAKTNEAHPTERADLFGRRMAATIETDEGKRMAEALLKQLTGGEKVPARRMKKDFFVMTPTWKLFLAANHKPVVRGSDYAIWRRIKLVPFTVTIADAEKDKNLVEKLKAERSGILNWMLAGCLDWQRDGMGEPEEVMIATDQYRAEQDTVAGFIAACCFVNDQVKARSSALFSKYVEWSGDKVMTNKALSARLEAKGFQCHKGRDGCMYFHGIGLPAGGQ